LRCGRFLCSRPRCGNYEPKRAYVNGDTIVPSWAIDKGHRVALRQCFILSSEWQGQRLRL
jgi:hypothetical protein